MGDFRQRKILTFHQVYTGFKYLNVSAGTTPIIIKSTPIDKIVVAPCMSYIQYFPQFCMPRGFQLLIPTYIGQC